MATNKKVEILQHLATLGTNDKEWTTELNIVSWYGKQPKFDLREWSPDHERVGKGALFTLEVAQGLADYFKSNDPERDMDIVLEKLED